ncbi:MAG: hypothetical protein AMXMBFR36_28090 [Acidobacteriota bacterium]
MRTNFRDFTRLLAVAAIAAALPASALAERELGELESYSYVRALEGQATLASDGDGIGEPAEANQPLLAGDLVQVARGARLEIVLADRNLLRLGGGTTLTLTRIAYSGDRGDRTTRIDLDQGQIVLVVGEDALGDQLPEIRTPGVDIVIHEPGVYRIEADLSGWTEVVAREGFAELVTRRGSTVVRTGDAAVAWSEGRGDVELLAAGAASPLERWGEDFDRQAERSSRATLYVEPELAYQAAALDQHGSWIEYDSSWYWRPTVAVGWRPYWQGRWQWTPSGLTWVSYEPWGWVPYHYGSWSRLAGYGWVWRPGRVYSPAWVYWHWSDSWTGWVPVGYYTSWYGSWGYGGFGWGTYGWAGGSWNDYRDWCFRPRRRVCDRDWRHWNRGPHDVEREHGPRVPRGILTTDTRDLPRHGLDRPEILTELERRARGRHGREDLPDVTDFVARRRDLPPTVVEAVGPRAGDRVRLRDVPVMANIDDDDRGRRVRPATTREDGARAVGSDRVRPTIANEDRQAPPRPVRPTVGVDRSGGDAGEPAVGRRAIPGTNPRVVPPTTRTDTGPRGGTVPGTNPRVVPPTTRTDTGPRGGTVPGTNPRVVPPTTRTDTGPRGGTVPGTNPRAVPPATRPEPGQRWTVDRPTTRPQPTPPADDRQGWRSGREVRPTVVDDGTGYRAPAPRAEPPVQRVFGGRRYDAPAPTYDSRGGDTRPTTPGTPRSYDSRPPSRVVVPTPPTGSRVTPSAPTNPRPTTRVGPPTSTSPRPTVTPRSQPPSSRPSGPPPSTSSSSGSRSTSSSGSSSRGDSPPPSRRSRDDGR